ncbi:hypothetical protein [Candidatus Amarobacter glycogenicus]|uniref:hypothetical protein n=1 Tax=Candidatus Amarobacter glycogenicus TaxID=3140699 RepID=UPI002A146F86|nr:hypothetical protein [Dehalococcoidia bacterium]
MIIERRDEQAADVRPLNVSTSGSARTTAQQTVGLFGTTRFGSSVFEVNPLVAILVYALIAWVLVKAIGLVIGDTRRGVRTTSSQIRHASIRFV